MCNIVWNVFSIIATDKNNIPYGQLSAKLPVILSLSHLTFGHLIIQSFSHSVTLSLGHSVTWSLGHSVTCIFKVATN